MFKRKNLKANIDFSTNKKRKFFNRKTGAILGGVVVTALAGSYLTTAKLPAKEQIFEKNIETVLQEYSKRPITRYIEKGSKVLSTLEPFSIYILF